MTALLQFIIFVREGEEEEEGRRRKSVFFGDDFN